MKRLRMRLLSISRQIDATYQAVVDARQFLLDAACDHDLRQAAQ